MGYADPDNRGFLGFLIHLSAESHNSPAVMALVVKRTWLAGTTVAVP